MIKLLIGGSPCTHWSIAQTKNRETTPEGIGWELFLNYLIARDKYTPDYFLYENNKSMSPSVRKRITELLGVSPTLINSALVSAQNRERLYWVGKRNMNGTYSEIDVPQPDDCKVFLQDVLETPGETWLKKAYTITATEYKGNSAERFLEKHIRTQIAIPINPLKSGKSRAVDAHMERLENDLVARINNPNRAKQQYDCIAEAIQSNNGRGGGKLPIYEVCENVIAKNGKCYRVNLPDGLYSFRKLTVPECRRLQTIPDTYFFPVSNTQQYKMLGNGWTVDVIAHIMSHFDGLTAERVEVLSMYDGMSCGQIALNKLGAKVERYYASEIDKYAVLTTQHNYPSTIQIGDAFNVRRSDWSLEP